MTAAELRSLAESAAEETALLSGMADQVRLRGLAASRETFGLPACDTHLIAKLRNMDPVLLATIRPTKADQ